MSIFLKIAFLKSSEEASEPLDRRSLRKAVKCFLRLLKGASRAEQYSTISLKRKECDCVEVIDNAIKKQGVDQHDLMNILWKKESLGILQSYAMCSDSPSMLRGLYLILGSDKSGVEAVVLNPNFPLEKLLEKEDYNGMRAHAIMVALAHRNLGEDMYSQLAEMYIREPSQTRFSNHRELRSIAESKENVNAYRFHLMRSAGLLDSWLETSSFLDECGWAIKQIVAAGDDEVAETLESLPISYSVQMLKKELSDSK